MIKRIPGMQPRAALIVLLGFCIALQPTSGLPDQGKWDFALNLDQVRLPKPLFAGSMIFVQGELYMQDEHIRHFPKFNVYICF